MKPRTASSLARTGDPPAPHGGRHLWKRTNQVVYPSPVVGYSGHFDEKTVHVLRGDKCFVRRYVRPHVPGTERQLTQQERFRLAQKKFSTLSAAERTGWKSWALSHAFAGRPHRSPGNAGQNAYAHAQCNRLGWGALSMSTEPPVEEAPPAPLLIEQVPAPSPDVFAFRIRHSVARPGGCRVLFEMTPATETLRRAPHERKFVWAGETTSDSFLPLGPDGAVYLLDRTRFSVPVGRRYGIRVCVVNSEGMAGAKITGDFVRIPPEEAAGEGEEGTEVEFSLVRSASAPLIIPMSLSGSREVREHRSALPERARAAPMGSPPG